MRVFPPALVAAYIAFALVFGPASTPTSASDVAEARPRFGAAPARVECGLPRTLRLRRFEDHSAQLLCAERVIVRISVPR